MSIPTGTVTFLFTDIEGSTRLAREHAETWERLRGRHHEILQAAIDGCHGYVFQVIGDAFCAAFHRPGDAVNAAVLAQQVLKECISLLRVSIHNQKISFLVDSMAYPPFQNPDYSAQILGALHYFYQQLKRPIGPLQKRFYDQVEAKARSSLGDAAFESSFIEGQNLSLDNALDLALEAVEKM